MIVMRLVPMLAFLGITSMGLLLALMLSGFLGYFYWSVRPISLTREPPAKQLIVPVPAVPVTPAEGMV